MRALRFSEFGDPAAVLRLVEEEPPTPGPNQVLVRMVARPINPSDLLTVAGQYGRLPRLPAVPGAEGMGTVAALGEGVTAWQVGDRVIPLGTVGGTWREFVVADAARLLPVPDAVSDQTAAQFVVNPVTAWVMLVEELALQPGDWLVQTAAGSTLGRVVIQLAAIRGFKTINLVRRPEQVEEMLALGGDAAFCTADETVAEQVRSLTGGRGATAAIEAVGGATGALALRCLRPGATMLVYGLLSGEPIPVDSGEMLFRGLTLRGFWLAHWFQATPPAQTVGVLSELMQFMAAGRLVPPVAAEYPLTEYRAAIAHAERPGRQGKVLLIG